MVNKRKNRAAIGVGTLLHAMQVLLNTVPVVGHHGRRNPSLRTQSDERFSLTSPEEARLSLFYPRQLPSHLTSFNFICPQNLYQHQAAYE